MKLALFLYCATAWMFHKSNWNFEAHQTMLLREWEVPNCFRVIMITHQFNLNFESTNFSHYFVICFAFVTFSTMVFLCNQGCYVCRSHFIVPQIHDLCAKSLQGDCINIIEITSTT